MPTVLRNDPYPGHNFHLIVNGVTDDGRRRELRVHRDQRARDRDPRDRVPQRQRGHHRPQGPGPEDLHAT